MADSDRSAHATWSQIPHFTDADLDQIDEADVDRWPLLPKDEWLDGGRVGPFPALDEERAE